MTQQRETQKGVKSNKVNELGLEFFLIGLCPQLLNLENSPFQVIFFISRIFGRLQESRQMQSVEMSAGAAERKRPDIRSRDSTKRHRFDILKLPIEIQNLIFDVLCTGDLKTLANIACANSQIRENILSHLEKRPEHNTIHWTLDMLYAFGIEDKKIIAILSDQKIGDGGHTGTSCQWRTTYSFPGHGEGLGFCKSQVSRLDAAAARGSHAMVNFLLAQPGYNVTPRAIVTAVLANKIDLAKDLMKRYLDESKHRLDRKDIKNEMLLHVFRAATFGGSVDMLDYLLEESPHEPHVLLNHKDQYGYSPIHYAIFSTNRVWHCMGPYLTARGAELRPIPERAGGFLNIDCHRLSQVPGSPKVASKIVLDDLLQHLDSQDLEQDPFRLPSDRIHDPNPNCELQDVADNLDVSISQVKKKDQGNV